VLSNKHRVPLEIAHQFLATFGITERTKEYERWVKEDGLDGVDGFDFEDINAVLSDSPYIFAVDWCAFASDQIELITKALAKLDIELETNIDPVLNRGMVGYKGRQVQVKFVPSESDDFTDVIIALQSLMPPEIEFRASPDNGQSDTWGFAVLPRDEWEMLEKVDAGLVQSLFICLSS
jgi:hypothetical protein